MPRLVMRAALAAAAAAFLAAGAAQAQTKLLRFPDIHGDTVAFCYAGDIWTAAAKGGAATRLTAHPGIEVFPKFSPDGKWIAFTGQYDGDEQVYVIPASGGVPRQLTFYPARGPLTPRWGYDNQVYGWTNDGKAVLFRSLRDAWDIGAGRLYTVSLEGGLPEPLPMPTSGAGTFSPDGKKVCYSPLFRDFRTWKRYQGGWAQDLWIYDLASNAAENITDNPRTDRDPMWIGGAIYFASDRDGTLNLYRYDVAGKSTTEVTHSTTFDVRWPSADRAAGRIVYELDGELQVLDTRTGASTPISIAVPDDGVAMRPARVSAEKDIEDFDLSPKGERALFSARGDVFTAPIEHGPTRNLTDSSNAHERWAAWSPDGARIAFISDRSGEDEVWVVNQDGSGTAQQLTSGGSAMRYSPLWSPDGARIAFSDKDGKLYVLTVSDKSVKEVAKDRKGRLRDYVWSPDSRWLAFSLSNPTGFRAVNVWGVADGGLHRVTGGFFNAEQPAWDPAGSYLFYLSDREFEPQLAGFELNYLISRTTGIFALALRKDVANPFPPESDEVKVDKDVASGQGSVVGKDEKAKAEDKGGKKDEAKKDEKKPIAIDFDGIEQRVAAVPVTAENYSGLTANADNLFVVKGSNFYLGRDAESKPALVVFSRKDRKTTTLAEDVQGYALSGDGSKILARTESGFTLYDAGPKGGADKKTVSTKELMADRVPAQEWAEIFNEVWRRYRDFFYVTNMNGYDWKALGDRYRPLVSFVAHRSDLNYVLGEMVAELNSGHCYIQGGDWQMPQRPKVALPGARFALDKATGRYRFTKIFQGQNEESIYRAPLTEIGVDVKAGDFLLAIDGVELKPNDDPYRQLRYKADRPVQLTVSAKPEMAGARTVTFKPISDESNLLYLDWVSANRARVDKLSGGTIGYLHIPDMSEEGMREFVKWYYPQVRKQGLIVDIRANGGGFISQMLIERLRRTLLGTEFSRTDEDTGTYPTVVFTGPMACLISETSASDGDIFPYMFRQAGLGPLIGKRTWGGVVGISGHGPLVDGGQVFVPEGGTASADGKWVIEGHGVDPDIVVENDPASVIAGKDPQLERGVAEVLKAMQTHPGTLPGRPPDPVKTH
jgi:tricorn protease